MPRQASISAVVTGITLLWQYHLPACPELESQQERVSPCVCVGGYSQSPHVGVLTTVLHFLWLAPFISIHYLFSPLFSSSSSSLLKCYIVKQLKVSGGWGWWCQLQVIHLADN